MLSVLPEWIPKGQCTWTDISSAQNLTDTPDAGDALPAKANTAVIRVSGAEIYLALDGDTATNTYPKLGVGYHVFENQRTALVNWSMLEESTSTRVDIWFYESPGG